MAAGRTAARRCGLTPERWERLKQLFDGALDRDPAQRSAFLVEACGGDETLRAEAEAMLARHDQSTGFLEAPAIEAEARALAQDFERQGSGFFDVSEREAARGRTEATAAARRAPWWMWLLAAVFLVDCLLRAWCRILGPESLGLALQHGTPQPVVEALHAGLAADRAGLLPGDVLRTVDGAAVGSLSDLRIVEKHLEVGRTVTLGIERDGEALQYPVEIRQVGFLTDPLQFQHALWQLDALLLLATALFIAFRRPNDGNARLGALALATLSVGLYFTNLPRGYAAIWRDLPALAGALLWIPNFCVYVAGPIVLTFLARFPRPLFRTRWPWFAIWLPALWFVPALAGLTWQTVFRAQSFPGAPQSGSALFAALALFGVYGIASVAALTVNYARLTSQTERRRLRVLLLGGAVATLPSLLRFVLWYVAPRSGLTQALESPAAGYVLALSFALFPLSVAYSILRHQLFDIRVMVRLGLRYAMARSVLLSLVPLLALLLVGDLLRHGDQPLLAVVQGRGWIYALLTLAALAAYALRTRWRDALDRRFFREQYDAHRLLLDVAARTVKARSFSDALPEVVDRIDLALHPRFTAVMRRARNDIVFAVEAAAPRGTVLPPLLPESGLIAALRASGAPLRTARDDAGLDSLRLTAHDRRFLSRSHSALMLPIAMIPPLDEALLVLGTKRSEQPYTPDDRDLLEAVAANLAVMLGRPAEPGADAPAGFGECPQCGACRDLPWGECPDDGAALNRVNMSRLLAGRYQFERRLSRGGMGAVYEATDQALERVVAIKVIREDRLDEADVAQRFRHEARAAASLSGEHFVTVFDYGVEAGRRAFLVMERLHGITLRDEIDREGHLDAARTLWVVGGIGAAMSAAHQQRLVHRDLKPDNIFLARMDTGGEAVKVLDFGVAQFLYGDQPADAGGQTEPSTGMLVGTPSYMSPEQLLGEPPDPRSDLWALGVIAYECLTGALPFPTDSRDAWRGAMLAGRHTPIAQRVPAPSGRWQQFFDDCLAVDRARRPQTATEFLVRLEEALH